MSLLATKLMTAYLGGPRALLTRIAPRSRRGATMIEYAILAAIAVIVGLAIQNFLAGPNGGWINRMLQLLNNKTFSTPQST